MANQLSASRLIRVYGREREKKEREKEKERERKKERNILVSVHKAVS